MELPVDVYKNKSNIDSEECCIDDRVYDFSGIMIDIDKEDFSGYIIDENGEIQLKELSLIRVDLRFTIGDNLNRIFDRDKTKKIFPDFITR